MGKSKKEEDEVDIDYSNLTKEELEDLLTLQQQMFCHYYLEALGNGTAAFQRMKDYKCSPTVAHSGSTKLLRKGSVKEYLKRLKAEAVKDIDIAYIVKSAQRTYDECMKPRSVRAYDPATKTMKATGETYVDSKGANGSMDVILKAIAESKRVSVEENEDAEISLAMNFVIKQKTQDETEDDEDGADESGISESDGN